MGTAVGLKEVRARAEATFRTTSSRTTPDQKKRRRRVADELKALEEAWNRLSPEAHELFRDAAAVSGLDEEDVGTLARLAQFYGAADPGRKRLLPHYSAAEELISYWRLYRKVTVTLYAVDGAPTRPSRTVRWLGHELRRLDPTLTRDQSWSAAFSIL